MSNTGWWQWCRCGCCRSLALCIGVKTYQNVLTLLLLSTSLIGLGCILNTLRVRQFYSFLFACAFVAGCTMREMMWFLFNIEAMIVRVVHSLTAQELMSMTLGLGAVAIIISLYGLIAPCCFVGERTNHDRLLSFFMIAFTGAMMIVSVFVQMRGNQRDEAETALDFGWHASYRDKNEQHKIEVAQVEFDCCGFYDKKSGEEVDRGVMPCPADSSGGCSAPLVEEHMAVLKNTAGLIYAGVLVGSLTILCLLGYLQRAGESKKAMAAHHTVGGTYEGVDDDDIDHETCDPLSQLDNDGFMARSAVSARSAWDADVRRQEEGGTMAADIVDPTDRSPTKYGRDDASVVKSASKRSVGSRAKSHRSNGSRHRRPNGIEP